jgi:hypothetical protein
MLERETISPGRRTAPAQAFEPGAVRQCEALVDLARNILRARMNVFRIFPKGLFHDEAWDMLLELYIGRHEGKTTLVKHLILSGASSTSGMRRVDALEAAGLISRSKLGGDHRCISVSLTESGITSLTILLQDIQAHR